MIKLVNDFSSKYWLDSDIKDCLNNDNSKPIKLVNDFSLKYWLDSDIKDYLNNDNSKPINKKNVKKKFINILI
jgi:hypothetical protein